MIARHQFANHSLRHDCVCESAGVIRFAGTDSDVTWLSIDRYSTSSTQYSLRHIVANTLIIVTSYGPHILAVVEDPEQYNVCQTVKEHSENMRRPVIWHVPGGAYSKNEAVSWLVCKARAVCTDTCDGVVGLRWMHQWEGFNMDEDWLITTKAGKRVLVIEADRYKQSSVHSLARDVTDTAHVWHPQQFRG